MARWIRRALLDFPVSFLRLRKMSSYQEMEIKLPLEDMTAGAKMLRIAGAEIEQPRHFEDNFVFDRPGLELRKAGKLLRVRLIKSTEKSEAGGILTFKGPTTIEDHVKQRPEVECRIQNPDDLIAILKEIGFNITFRYQKYRTVYRKPPYSLHICMDETPIGHFLELEGEVQQIHEFAAEIGFDKEQFMTSSYASLYFDWCREKGIAPSEMVFP